MLQGPLNLCCFNCLSQGEQKGAVPLGRNSAKTGHPEIWASDPSSPRGKFWARPKTQILTPKSVSNVLKQVNMFEIWKAFHGHTHTQKNGYQCEWNTHSPKVILKGKLVTAVPSSPGSICHLWDEEKFIINFWLKHKAAAIPRFYFLTIPMAHMEPTHILRNKDHGRGW